MPIYTDQFPLLRLLRQRSERFDLRLIGMVGLSGFASALLLAIINGAAENAANAAANERYLVMFLIAIALYIVTQRHVLFTTVIEVERILHQIRTRLADLIRRSDLLAVERVGRSTIYASLNRETLAISQATSTLAIALQSTLLVLFSVLYLAWLSRTAFVVTALITYIGLVMHFRKAAEYDRLLREATGHENTFNDSVTHLLDGFKEVKLSETRAADLSAHIHGISHSLEDLKIRTGSSFAAHFVFAQTAFYLLIAGIVFLLPRISTEYSDVVVKATAAVLFIIGPLGGIVGSIPVFSTANVAARNIEALEALLSRPEAQEPGPAAAVEPPGPFQRIVMQGVRFEYRDPAGHPTFGIGPFDLEVRQGEILFIVGGNGSGKSTFLKVLTGLYFPQAGAIRVNGLALTRERASRYRSHFGAIFSDYHLFDRFYGLRDVENRRVRELLQMMQLEDKTDFVEGRFTNLDLSTGQRKRLALVATLVEDRPVLVFDEWAADQDPGFRRFFYEELLRDLKARGKTVVAVTHDDRYFHVADRVLKMDYGQFVPFGGA